MNDDIISREALKKAIADNGYSHYFEILDIIDKAPSVEGYKNVIVGGMNNPYNAGYMDGIRQAYKELERPQGEWIEVTQRISDSETSTHWECSICHEPDRKNGKSKFCCECGADMRGENTDS